MNKIKLNKKAQFEAPRKTIYWTIIGFVVVLVVLAFVLITDNYKNRLAYVPPELTGELISLRFTHLPDCFAYQDDSTKRVFPGVIDFYKFNKDQLDKCYFPEKKEGYEDYNFALSLTRQNLSISTNNYFNKVDFTIYKEVLVRKDNHLVKDQLTIYVQEKI